MPRLHRILSLKNVLVWALAGLAAAGCVARKTFPPTTGKSYIDPSIAPLPGMMAAAIKEGHARSSVAGGEIVYNLPAGMRKQAWKRISELLPEASRPSVPGDRQVVSVEQVRLDGSIGQVDILVPQGDYFQLYTLHMQGAIFDPWKVTTAQPWTIRNEPPACNNPWASESGSAASDGDASPADTSADESADTARR
ncbi:MAG: hypothetical protein SGJ11_11835 [Phycisphaerae bacterium]|nr:hypothetical protein [Phycisphaerae bacterium]